MPAITVAQAFQHALAQHQAGRLPEAEQIYRQILAVEPDFSAASHYLGVIAHQMGQNEAAVELIGQALALAPADATAHNHLGSALYALRRLDEAAAACRRALALQPDLAEAHCNLGSILREQGRLDQAIDSLRRALALRPDLAAAHENLGCALFLRGETEPALLACQRAIALDPTLAGAHGTLGNALQRLGKFLPAAEACRRTIALRPGDALSWSNLGVVLKAMGQLDEAIDAGQHSVALPGAPPEAFNNLANSLKDAGRLDEAIAAYRRGLGLDPLQPVAHSNLILALHYDSHTTASMLAEETERWHILHAAPLCNSHRPHPNDRSSDRCLRIGYVSPDFRGHAVGYQVLPVISGHDRAKFEVFCYADVTRRDALTERFAAAADHWRETGALSDEALADQIRADRIDLLIDLAQHTAGHRLLVFARRPAPVQISFAGYPGSTGLHAIDYRLSDRFLDPASVTPTPSPEQIVHLPDSFWCYDAAVSRGLSVNSLPALAAGHITFGCLNSFWKITDPILRLWARLLAALPTARLILLAPPGRHRDRIRALLGLEGATADRVEFVSPGPMLPYLEQYHRIDLVIDTFPYNGHTTSLDALWMGVPVLTLVGDLPVSRGGLSQLSQLGLAEWITDSPEEYVRRAIEFAADLPGLAHLRSTLRGRMVSSPLMDIPRFVRGIESAYRDCWIRCCASAATGAHWERRPQPVSG